MSKTEETNMKTVRLHAEVKAAPFIHLTIFSQLSETQTKLTGATLAKVKLILI